MKEKIVLGFYKYAEIESLEKFAKEHLNFCKQLGLLGKILVGREGINGSVSGDRMQIDLYRKELTKNKIFSDIEFKEEIAMDVPFDKMKVKVRDEIVTFDCEVDVNNQGKHLSPEEFLSFYDENGNLKEKDVIILDARNNYEYDVGRFKGAIHLDIEKFSDFPKAVEEKIIDQKDKKVVMYCTGGIRCEKASAFLKEKGFQDVSQIHNGIINFGQNFPDTGWEGKCFVFDKRLVAPLNKEDSVPLTNCELCEKPCDFYRNCWNQDCDKLFISCVDCEKKMNGCCSEDCFKVFKEFCKEKSIRNFGRKSLRVDA